MRCTVSLQCGTLGMAGRWTVEWLIMERAMPQSNHCTNRKGGLRLPPVWSGTSSAGRIVVNARRRIETFCSGPLTFSSMIPALVLSLHMFSGIHEAPTKELILTEFCPNGSVDSLYNLNSLEDHNPISRYLPPTFHGRTHETCAHGCPR